jgi:hypothetical protein
MKMHQKSSCVRFWIMLLLLTLGGHAQAATTPTALNIYLSPDGVDTNTGLSPHQIDPNTGAYVVDPKTNIKVGSPVLTLTQAQTIAQGKFSPALYNAVNINIAPGLYKGQYVNWTFLPGNGIPLTVQGVDPLNKPVFDGAGLKREFFIITWLNGGKTYATIKNLHIMHYLTSALQVRGDDSIASHDIKFNSGTIIERNIFEQIGSRYVFSDEDNFSALSLIGTRGNTIQYNIFSQIDDIDPGRTGLHSIYAAHYAKDNTIQNNTFLNTVGGQVVKVRNQSDNNTIINNTFINNRNKSAVYNWFCEKATNTGCTRAVGECPNFETYVDGNRVVMSSQLDDNDIADPSRLLYLELKYDKAKTACPINVDSRKRVSFGTTNTDHGCFASVENCPYMGKDDTFEFLDANIEAQSNLKTCSDRAAAFYSSCSKQSGGMPQMAKTRYLGQQSQLAENIVADGCVITASYCPRLGFAPQESRLDSNAASHTTESVCLSRAVAYRNSCTPGLYDQEVVDLKVRAQFFVKGMKKSESTAVGSICVPQDTVRGGAETYNVTRDACLTICKNFLATAPAAASVYDCRYDVGATDEVLLAGRGPK